MGGICIYDFFAAVVCVSTAPVPIELASVRSVNGRFQSGNANTIGEAKRFLRLENDPSCSTVQGMGNFRARFVAKSFLRRMSVRGYAIILLFSTNCLKYPVSPRKARNTSMFVGRGILATASIFDGAGRIPFMSTITPGNSWADAAKLHWESLRTSRLFVIFGTLGVWCPGVLPRWCWR